MPLRREGLSRSRSFWYGQLSGMVEPMAGVLGAAVVLVARPLLPYALAFAAGAMIFVVIEELGARVADRRAFARSNHGSHARVCGHDDTGRGTGVIWGPPQ